MSGWTREATHWSLLLQSGEEGWSYFYERYRAPVAALFRRGGLPLGDVDDQVHDFFVNALDRDLLGRADPERGCFRAYRATAARRHLASHDRAAKRQKRDPGPGGVVQLDEHLDARPQDGPTLDEAFDRAWAEAILARAKAAVAADHAARGKAGHQRAFELRLAGAGWPAVARELGATEAAVRGWASRYGDKLAEAVRREIADTVSSAAELDAELAYMSQVLAAHEASPPAELG